MTDHIPFAVFVVMGIVLACSLIANGCFLALMVVFEAKLTALEDRLGVHRKAQHDQSTDQHLKYNDQYVHDRETYT